MIASSISVSSRFSVSGRMSTNTGPAPRSTNALAVETKVNDGMITSSPGSRSSSSAAISSAAVHECRQQRAPGSESRLEPRLTLPRERAIPREVQVLHRLFHVPNLATREMWAIERQISAHCVRDPAGDQQQGWATVRINPPPGLITFITIAMAGAPVVDVFDHV